MAPILGFPQGGQGPRGCLTPRHLFEGVARGALAMGLSGPTLAPRPVVSPHGLGPWGMLAVRPLFVEGARGALAAALPGPPPGYPPP